MYILKKIDVDKITEFRSTLEWGALETGVRQATEDQRRKMMTFLDNLEEAETEEERVRWDKAIHYLLIEASGNFCMLANYKALNKIMDEYIPKMRGRIIEGMHSEQFLSRAHRTLAEGFAEGNLESESMDSRKSSSPLPPANHRAGMIIDKYRGSNCLAWSTNNW